ncbi:peptidase M6 [candidate division KSB1 bacterium]
MKKSLFFRSALTICTLTAVLLVLNGCMDGEVTLPPIDPQVVQDQEDMTWDDYVPIPGKNWADPSLVPPRQMKIALIAIDFPDQPFVVTLPKYSDPFGNPQVDPVPREEVPQFYADFYNKPSEVNHGQTINGYWMEQSRGKVGVAKMDVFGPYLMPKNLWEYGLNEFGQRDATPTGEPARSRMERDCDAIWSEDAGDVRRDYDAVLRIYAGYDETGIWQEFGEMKFQTKEDIPPEWGNPNPDLPRWVTTRYVEWTSWKAGAQQWGLSSMRQGENSGTITHEIGHFLFRTGDNNNNPYIQPYRRVGSGVWDMMDRGCFNGPEGPHSRWKVPAVAGAAMPAGLMLRQKLNFEFITQDQVLSLSRDGLAGSGMAVANVTARAVDPLPNSLAGIVIRLDGDEPHDRTPPDDPSTNPLSPGNPNYNFYSVEVIQRIGYDSFTPDNGVLIAKNKDRDGRGSGTGGPNGFNCFNWVIDAHPEDINMVDYYKPGDGTPVMRTVADYRQVNDALFHSGTNSGSFYEWKDEPNRLHFYIIDLQKNPEGLLSYTIGVRSLDGKGPHNHGASTDPGVEIVQQGKFKKCIFTLNNTGSVSDVDDSLHPQITSEYLNYDIYRLRVSADAPGWSAQLQNELVAVKFGESVSIPVFVRYESGDYSSTKITLKAVSESDPSVTVTAAMKVSK